MSAYYDEVLRALNVYPLNQHFDRSWTAHVAVKSALYDAESQMQAAAAQRAEDNIHIEITRLKVRGHTLFNRCNVRCCLGQAGNCSPKQTCERQSVLCTGMALDMHMSCNHARSAGKEGRRCVQNICFVRVVQ